MKKVISLAGTILIVFVLVSCSSNEPAPDPLAAWYGTWAGDLEYTFNTGCGYNDIQTFTEPFILVIKGTGSTSELNMVCSYFDTYPTATGSIAIMSATPDLSAPGYNIGFPTGKIELINNQLSISFTKYQGSCNGFPIMPPHSGTLTKQ